MSLVEKFQGLSHKTKSYCYTSAGYVTMRGLDVLSTTMGCKKHGVDGEVNPLIRHLMSEQGIDEGMLTFTIPITALVLGAAYISNKIGEEISDNKIVQNIGTIGLLAGSAYGLEVVANNFIYYMN